MQNCRNSDSFSSDKLHPEAIYIHSF